ncbi:MAG: RNA pseudouridine synthase [Lachnospiraceae bacterium]|nr:RNA pseudouridine synthase [Lachnospiraceae bacterium]
MRTPRIIRENEDFLIVYKPAGMASETARVTEMDLETWLLNYRRKKNQQAEIHLIERLDQPVEGLLLAAKTKKAAAELSDLQRKGFLEKTYQALVSLSFQSEKTAGTVEQATGSDGMSGAAEGTAGSDGRVGAGEAAGSDGMAGTTEKAAETHGMAGLSEEGDKLAPEGRFTDFLKKNPKSRMAETTESSDPAARKAVLDYKVLENRSNQGYPICLIEIHLVTGRFHQIRAQFSSRGWPIVGDRRYGGRPARRLNLSSVRLSFPWKGENVSAEIEPDFCEKI